MTEQLSTTGLEQKYNAFKLSDGSSIGCIIYDTNGTDRYKLLNETLFKKADGLLLVYDVTNRRSFEKINDYYFPKIKELCKKNIYILLLGNKNDMGEKRKVTIEEGNEFALNNNCNFKEVSCFENVTVFDAFQNIIENSFYEKKRNWNNDNESLILNRNNHRNINMKNRIGCC